MRALAITKKRVFLYTENTRSLKSDRSGQHMLPASVIKEEKKMRGQSNKQGDTPTYIEK